MLIQYIDKTDLAEYANAADLPLGTFPTSCGLIFDENLTDNISAVSDGKTVTYISISQLIARIASKLANDNGLYFAAVIPLSTRDSIYLQISNE